MRQCPPKVRITGYRGTSRSVWSFQIWTAASAKPYSPTPHPSVSCPLFPAGKASPQATSPFPSSPKALRSSGGRERTAVSMFPRDPKEAESHQNVLPDNHCSDRPVDQSGVPHGESHAHHERLICDRVNQRAQPTFLIKVTSNESIAKVQGACKGECWVWWALLGTYCTALGEKAPWR